MRELGRWAGCQPEAFCQRVSPAPSCPGDGRQGPRLRGWGLAERTAEGTPEGTRGPSERRPGPRLGAECTVSVLTAPLWVPLGSLRPALCHPWPLQLRRQKPNPARRQEAGMGTLHRPESPGSLSLCWLQSRPPCFEAAPVARRTDVPRGQAWVPYSLPDPSHPTEAVKLGIASGREAGMLYSRR